MSTQATAGRPAVAGGYDPFLPYNPGQSQRLLDENGPKCTRCARPFRVPGEAGGCACPRHWAPEGGASAGVFKPLDERNVEALEAIVRIGLAFARSMNVEVGEAAPSAAALPAAPGAGPLDTGRVADPRRKVS